MKIIIGTFSQLVASVYLCLLIGLAVVILLVQNSWLDMRFDSEYIVTISILTGVWLFFLRMFMNARKLAFWESGWVSGVIAAVSLAIIIMGRSFSVLPADIMRKALFLEQALTLEETNQLLIVIISIGIVILVLAAWYSKETKKAIDANRGWAQLSGLQRFCVMALYSLIALFALVYLGQGEIRDLINQSTRYLQNADVEGFRDYLLSFGSMAAVVSALLMVFQSIIAPLPAFVITFANGLLFGWVWGAVLSWCSAMAGAVLCFYLAKIMGRPVVEKVVTKKALKWWDQFFEKYGKHAVFIARIVPIVSFDLVSYAAGVTSISFWQFFWATGLGQLPATILYSYLGQNATSTVKILFTIFTILIALGVIGMMLRPKFRSKGKGNQGANG